MTRETFLLKSSNLVPRFLLELTTLCAIGYRARRGTREWGLPRERAASCDAEYQRMARAWGAILEEHTM